MQGGWYRAVMLPKAEISLLLAALCIKMSSERDGIAGLNPFSVLLNMCEVCREV